MSLREKLADYWQCRQPRERLALTLLFVVLLSAFVVWVLWTAHTERLRLRSLVPRQAAQLEALKAGAEEWRRLATLPDRSPPGEEIRKAIPKEARALGLEANWVDANGLHVIGQVDFDAWISWLGQAHHDHTLRVVRVRSRRVDSGLVAVEAELVIDAGRSSL